MHPTFECTTVEFVRAVGAKRVWLEVVEGAPIPVRMVLRGRLRAMHGSQSADEVWVVDARP